MIGLIREGEKAEKKKIKQESVVYMTPEQIGTDEGAHCGECFFFHRPTSQCFITSPSKCNAQRGVCDYYIHGNLWKDIEGKVDKIVPQELVPKEAAGYTEDGPTHCKTCEYFEGPHACSRVRGHVDAHGCCNNWDGGD